MRVEVLDRMMGTGKTNAILKWLSPDMKFIFVTPLLSEIENRINESRPDLSIKSPSPSCVNIDGQWVRSKSEDMLTLLQNRENIATTHSLLRNCDKRHWDLISEFGYIIILDEEISIIESFTSVPSADMMWLFDNGHLSRDEVSGRLTFTDSSVIEDFRYSEVKEMCGKGMLYSAKRSNKFIVSCIPINIITCASRVIILTYMFKGSILEQFLLFNGIGSIEFTDVDVADRRPSEYSSLIRMVDQRHYKPYSSIKLTQSSWLRLSGDQVGQVEKTIRNVLQPFTAHESAFSTPKSAVVRNNGCSGRLVKPKGKIYSDTQDTWIYPKCRATNEYVHKIAMCYAIDVYPNSAVMCYLSDMGYVVNEKRYALSQLVQWVWRSAIRENKQITLAILPPRMLSLFNSWMRDEFYDHE